MVYIMNNDAELLVMCVISFQLCSYIGAVDFYLRYVIANEMCRSLEALYF